MNFSDKLIQLRKQEGLSQEELGYKVNVARQTISKWETGETTPELGKLKELSKLFNVSVDDLIGNDNYVSINNKKQYYEYISKTKIGNLPLVHINIGYNLRNLRKAKGVFALGNYAKGIFALGGISLGIFALGGISLGLFATGGLALALLLAIGGISIGTIAIGGVALGIFAIGGVAVGIYSIGGIAVARDIAAGGISGGHIALGYNPNGPIKFMIEDGKHLYTSQEVRTAILKEFPNVWNIIVSIFSNV